jgi:hypothetical protein
MVRPEREAVMEEQPSASTKDELAGKQETKHLWLLLFYGVVLLAILLSHFGLMRDVEGSTVALLLILALPFLLPYLKSIEAFGVKVDLRDEVRELRNEVRDTKNEVRDTKESLREEVRAINQRFEQLVRSSQGFLEPAPLPEVWKYINEMKETLRANPLSSDQVDKCLASLDPNLRIPAYIELQTRPQISRFEELLDCLYLEQFLARKKGETRPMWQLIETMHCLLGTFSDLASDRRGYGRFVLSQGLDFLTNNKSLDPGGECKNHLRTLLNRL